MGKTLSMDKVGAVERMPAEMKQSMVNSTAFEIATLMFFSDHKDDVFAPPFCNIQELIDQRKKGLKALGVKDIGAEIQMAKDKFDGLSEEERVAVGMKLFVLG